MELAPQRPLLSLTDVIVDFPARDGSSRRCPAVESLTLDLFPGEVLALVGESGCGKSLTSLAVLGLLPQTARLNGGTICFEGQRLDQLSPEAYRRLRGARMALIPQDPLTALNPVYPVGEQIAEVIQVHHGVSHQVAMARTVELLEAVRIPNARERAREYPHQFSGGMRQRVMIAMALSCQPSLLIADEPTTALDVTVQAQILTLLNDLRREHDMAILLITHDLGVVAEVADRVAVMYAGQIVEQAPVVALFEQPSHPYTQGLLASIPTATTVKGQLQAIGGQPPGIDQRPKGCLFAPRCPQVMPHCEERPPLLWVQEPAHASRCWLVDQLPQ